MKRSIILFGILALSASCKKFLDPGQPATQLTSTTVFNSDQTATAAMLSIYAQLENQGSLGNLVSNTGMSSDEFLLNSSSAVYLDVLNNNLTPANSLTEIHWMDFYKLIYQANAVIEKLAPGTAVTNSVKDQLEGEARFVRALFYFYLVNLYGDIPLVTSTDYTVNSSIKRSTVENVYQFVSDELIKASSLLAPEYRSAINAISTERVRPNRWAAQALLSRVYLYRSQWKNSQDAASAVIGQAGVYELPPILENVFLKNSKEQVWQVQAVIPNFNTFIGFLLSPSAPPSSVHLRSSLLNLFAATDKRKTAWTTVAGTGADSYYFPFKYKLGFGASSVTEYTSILRLAEQYLNRAEALAMQDKLDESITDLNKVRNRAGLAAVAGLSKSALLDSIHLERQRELFTENGERWFDLKRTGKATQVLSTVKGNNWAVTDQLYPIPHNEILRNNQLVQNPGY